MIAYVGLPGKPEFCWVCGTKKDCKTWLSLKTTEPRGLLTEKAAKKTGAFCYRDDDPMCHDAHDALITGED